MLTEISAVANLLNLLQLFFAFCSKGQKGYDIMKAKQILSILLSIAIMFGVFSIPALAEKAPDTVVYLTVSNQGVLASDNEGAAMANRPVTVTDINEDGALTYEEALISAHKAYNSEDGYLAPSGFVSKLWGVDSQNNLFFANNTSLTAGVSADTVKEGDYLVASINKDSVYWADWYTFFDKTAVTAKEGGEVTLNLKGHLGMAYTPEALEDKPLAGLKTGLWENEIFTENAVTDENGNVTLSFEKAGTYYVTAEGTVQATVTDYNLMSLGEEPAVYGTIDFESGDSSVAYTEKDYGEGPYPAEEILYVSFDEWNEAKENYFALKSSSVIAKCPIMAPVCVIEVKEDKPAKALNNLAERLFELEISADGSMQWMLADLASYKQLFPETENTVSEEEIQKCLNIIINDAETATYPSSLAKDIIALRAMGFDPENLYNAKSEKVDALARLITLVDEKAESVTNPYTLSYVLLALQQGEDYMTKEQQKFLLDAAILGKAGWQSTEWGIDAATPMILALAPYIENDDVKGVINETLEIIDAELEKDNHMVKNSASTALLIAALSAIGKDAEETGIIDELMTYANEDLNGFAPETNLISTEQGFRGLLGWYHLKEQTGKRVYDFKDMPLNEGRATVEKEEDTPSGGGSVSTNITVKVKVMTHSKEECANSYSYKENKDKYQPVVNTSVAVPKGASVFDALVKALDKENVAYVASKGYVEEIDGTGEFEHGAYSGWMYVLNGNYVNTGASEKTVSAGDEVIWFFTDDYSKEKGSENYRPSTSGGGGGGSAPVVKEEGKQEEVKPEPVKTFADVEKDVWYSEAVDYVLKNNFMKGESETEFKPENNMTRAMLVTVLYRMAGEPETEKETDFNDVAKDSWYKNSVMWATEKGIVAGYEDNTFKGDENITREQLALILYRFAKGEEAKDNISEYEDAEEISDYAITALNWAVENKLINGVSEKRLAPKETATRAQIALIIMRYAEMEHK